MISKFESFVLGYAVGALLMVFLQPAVENWVRKQVSKS